MSFDVSIFTEFLKKRGRKAHATDLGGSVRFDGEFVGEFTYKEAAVEIAKLDPIEEVSFEEYLDLLVGNPLGKKDPEKVGAMPFKADLEKAACKRLYVQAKYEDSHYNVTERTIVVVSVTEKYAVSWDTSKKAWRSLRLDRFQEVALGEPEKFYGGDLMVPVNDKAALRFTPEHRQGKKFYDPKDWAQYRPQVPVEKREVKGA
jgi:hypothetical protein